MTDDYPCSDNGNDCQNIYALNLGGVKPSTNITWFQVQQACFNSGKELLSNAVWQGAAAGTPDLGTDNGATDCNTAYKGSLADPVKTGSRFACVSRWGTFDMVGNVWELTADWTQDNEDIAMGPFTSPLYGKDSVIGVDATYSETDGFPAVKIRGGGTDCASAGVFAFHAGRGPSDSFPPIGFRCGR